MSGVTHSLVGYDRKTERVAEEIRVPDAVLPRAKELARVPHDDPEAMMCYALDAPGARGLAELLKAKVDTDRRDYFLDGFAEEEASHEFAAAAGFRPEDGVKPND